MIRQCAMKNLISAYKKTHVFDDLRLTINDFRF